MLLDMSCNRGFPKPVTMAMATEDKVPLSCHNYMHNFSVAGLGGGGGGGGGGGDIPRVLPRVELSTNHISLINR